MSDSHTYGREAKLWNLNFNLDFTVEIPTENARAVLPPQLHPLEVRPGVSLLWVGLIGFDEGNLGYLPEFKEATCSIMIKPDLSDGYVPRFAIYVVNIASECGPFLRWARHKDKMPVYRDEGIDIELHRDDLGGVFSDSCGPAFELKNAHPAPLFEEGHFDVQTLTQVDGALWRQHVQWAGEYFEHQQKGATVQLFDHPFFKGLGLGEGPRPCYLQMMTPPRTASVMRFEEPVRID